MSNLKSIALITSQAFSIANFRGPLVAELVSRGVKVYALAPDFDDVERQRVINLGAIPYDYTLRRTGLNPFHDFMDMLKLAYLLHKLAPDAMFAYFIKPVIYGSLAAFLARIPIRYSLIPGLGYVFSGEVGRFSLRNFLYHCVSILYRISLGLNKVVILQNCDDANYLVSRKILGKDKYVIVPGTGVDISYYSFQAPVLKPVTFVLVARMLKEKGVYEYVDAARLIKNIFPKTRFLLVGGTDSNPNSVSEADLRHWVDEGVVEWFGQVPDIRPLVTKSSVFVLPSYYREGVPRGNQEAMALGRPIITTDWVGCKDTVVHGKNGFLVPVKDVQALVGAMKKFIECPELVCSMGKESRAIAESKYDVRMINKRMLEIFGL